MKRLLRINMVGCRWTSGGMRYPGFCHAFIEGEVSPRYYTEDACPDSIVADLKTKGVDTSDYERGMAHWVKTGQGFDVLTGRNCAAA